MALTRGTRLGPYEISAQIGVGGMGEVYQATDTNLARQVAIKVLPEAVAADAERLARFDREAKTLAALNHPNIAQIYGLERGDSAAGPGRAATLALVMELVEGPTLADRIADGAIPVAEALPIAKQIADALEAAHEQGIIHRDLKPANVKVRQDGAVKVLDFGLAKALEPASTLRTSGQAQSMAPTITTPAMTQAGMILGTAAYMSPEQARGKPVDRRADIWAFGCVLFEMLTARRAFEAEDVSLTLAEVIKSEPDWSAVPALPPLVDSFLRQCLRKDLRQRAQAIGDVRLALEGAFETRLAPAGMPAAPTQARPLWRRALPLAATAVVVGISATTAGRLSVFEVPRPVVRAVHALPAGTAFRTELWNVVDVAPTGERFVYNRFDGLVVRELDSFEERVIPNTDREGIVSPVFSPDGESVAYYDFLSDELRRIGVTGGASLVLARAEDVMGPSWGADGTILYGLRDGIWEVAENGGEPRHLITTNAGERADTPHRLPGGEWVLFTLAQTESGLSRWDDADIVAQSLDTGERRTIWSGGSGARYVPTGHLVFVRENVLYAMPFDVDRLVVSGVPVPVVQGVRATTNRDANSGTAFLSVSDRGDLVYVPGTGLTSESIILGLADRAGQVQPLAMPPGNYDYPRVSPDGRRVAFVTVFGDGVDIAVYNIGGESAPRRLTFGGGGRYPIWSSDGTRIAFQDARSEPLSLAWQPSDGSGPAEPLTTAEDGTAHVPDSFSQDGKWLSFTVASGDESSIWRLSLETLEVAPLIVESGARVSQSAFSPDTRWMAYQTTETGQDEIFVQPFPPTGTKHQLPGTLDNHHPFWSPDGRELFYVPGPGLFAAAGVTTDAGFDFGNPVQLTLNGRLRMAGPQTVRRVDAMPNGSGFLGVMGEVAERTRELTDPALQGQIRIVQNWTSELQRLVPTQGP